MKTYQQYRTCGQCKTEEVRTLTADQAAFEETRKWTDPCSQCGNSEFSSQGCPLPDMNRDLFEEWIHRDDLTVLSQDEDLVMGVGENLPLLEEFLARPDALPSKRAILLSAICVVLYDNLPDADGPDGDRDPEIAVAAKNVLKRNILIFDQVDEHYICDYIKDAVYPVIGRPIQQNT